MKTIGNIDLSLIKNKVSEVPSSEVIITDERYEHISQNHSCDLSLFDSYSKTAIENPDEIIIDIKNERTLFFVKFLESGNLNIIVKLATGDRNSVKNTVLTSYRLRQKNLEKLEEKNQIIYKKE